LVPLLSSQRTLCLLPMTFFASVSLTVLIIRDLSSLNIDAFSSSYRFFFEIGWCLLANQLLGPTNAPMVLLLLLVGVLLLVLCRMETSKLLDRELLSRLRLCSAVLSDQVDFCSSFALDASDVPHVFISVADDVRELKMDIRSVLEHVIPAAVAVPGISESGLVNSDARLRKADVDAATDAENSENRRFWCCMYFCVELLLPSRDWISHTRSRDGVLYIFKRTWDACTSTIRALLA